MFMPPDPSMRRTLIQQFSSPDNAAIIGPMSSGNPTRPGAVAPAPVLSR
jgi:hypothetical protein